MKAAMRWLASLLLLLSNAGMAEAPCFLQLEVEILDLGGPLSTKEFNRQLASPALDVTANYVSDKRIENVTARYERIMPIGRKWFPIPQTTVVSGDGITRSGWRLRCTLPDSHPAHASYRLAGASLHVPMPSSVNGLPQPSLEVDLIDAMPETEVKERKFPWRSVDISVTLRVRTHWVN